jgi:hypothetical protein
MRTRKQMATCNMQFEIDQISNRVWLQVSENVRWQVASRSSLSKVIGQILEVKYENNESK